MFKKYNIRLKAGKGIRWTLDFYVHSKGTRNGFMHQAIVTGCLPKNDPGEYTDREHKVRYHRVSYTNRTWEAWSGQTCLKELWENLTKCSLFMKELFPKNPFRDGAPEPKHEDLQDPDYLFDRS